jgi:molybdate transport system substrate-binding protein
MSGEKLMKARRFALIFAAISFISSACAAQEISVAAAADLQFAMQDIASRFQKETGKTVKATYGSSGNFLQQIQNGAPFDVFFSANLDYPKKLDAAGLTEPGSYYEYARGKIVIWVPSDSKLDLSPGMKVLLDPSIKKIAIANPLHAPYGQAAVAALEHENIYDNVKDKFVLGENISQTASFVVAGAADAGIVALSLALSPNMKDKGRYVEVPTTDYPPIEQACVILRSAKNKKVAEQFLAFVKTSAVRDVLRSYGFGVPESRATDVDQTQRAIGPIVMAKMTQSAIISVSYLGGVTTAEKVLPPLYGAGIH